MVAMGQQETKRGRVLEIRTRQWLLNRQGSEGAWALYVRSDGRRGRSIPKSKGPGSQSVTGLERRELWRRKGTDGARLQINAHRGVAAPSPILGFRQHIGRDVPPDASASWCRRIRTSRFWTPGIPLAPEAVCTDGAAAPLGSRLRLRLRIGQRRGVAMGRGSPSCGPAAMGPGGQGHV